jgi:hypothetical protein
MMRLSNKSGGCFALPAFSIAVLAPCLRGGGWEDLAPILYCENWPPPYRPASAEGKTALNLNRRHDAGSEKSPPALRTETVFLSAALSPVGDGAAELSWLKQAP